MTRKYAPPTSYTIRRNAVSIMKDLITVYCIFKQVTSIHAIKRIQQCSSMLEKRAKRFAEVVA